MNAQKQPTLFNSPASEHFELLLYLKFIWNYFWYQIQVFKNRSKTYSSAVIKQVIARTPIGS